MDTVDSPSTSSRVKFERDSIELVLTPSCPQLCRGTLTIPGASKLVVFLDRRSLAGEGCNLELRDSTGGTAKLYLRKKLSTDEHALMSTD